jgi:hypothetical protein
MAAANAAFLVWQAKHGSGDKLAFAPVQSQDFLIKTYPSNLVEIRRNTTIRKSILPM